MKELKILYLYPDMLELYGDYGNISKPGMIFPSTPL